MRRTHLLPALSTIALLAGACAGNAPGSPGASTSSGGATAQPAQARGSGEAPASPGTSMCCDLPSAGTGGGSEAAKALLAQLPTAFCDATAETVAIDGPTFFIGASPTELDELASIGKTPEDIAVAQVRTIDGDRVCAAGAMQILGAKVDELDSLLNQVGARRNVPEVDVNGKKVFSDGALDYPAYHWFMGDTVFHVTTTETEDAHELIGLMP